MLVSWMGSHSETPTVILKEKWSESDLEKVLVLKLVCLMDVWMELGKGYMMVELWVLKMEYNLGVLMVLSKVKLLES